MDDSARHPCPNAAPGAFPDTRTPFTLIELLVVVAIIAVLAALLLPSLTRAKAKAKSAVCGGNQKQIALAMFQFSDDNDGRATGRVWATAPHGYDFYSGILNREVFNHDLIQRWGPEPTAGKLYCPSMQRFKLNLPRGYAPNLNVVGGANWGTNPKEGVYGLLLDGLPGSYDEWYWEEYALGAKLDRFQRPTTTFMLGESETGGDIIKANWPYNGVLMSNSANHPSYSGSNGMYAFRHNMTGNFLMIDGHVESLRPTAEINTVTRFSLD